MVFDGYKRVRCALKSKLKRRDLMKTVNSYAATSVEHYTVGIVSWTMEQLERNNRITIHQVTLYRALQPKSDIERFYKNTKAGGQEGWWKI